MFLCSCLHIELVKDLEINTNMYVIDFCQYTLEVYTFTQNPSGLNKSALANGLNICQIYLNISI